jgi:hypothetical protein
MSTGGVFSLVANKGKSDAMILATKLLNQRIRNIMCARRDAGKADLTPTLTDLERTHVLYMNAHFKPHAAIGQEYNKVRPQSGSATLGGSVTYSIPQFGDFFHDMVHHVTIGAARGKPGKVSNVDMPANGVDWDGTTLTNATYKLVDAVGNEVPTDNNDDDYDDDYYNLVKYCDYPGERLHQNTKFDVNGNPLDEYSWRAQAFLRKFCLSKDKTAGYNRMVGQENPIYGKGNLRVTNVGDSSNEGGQNATMFTDEEAAKEAAYTQSSNGSTSNSFDHALKAFPDTAWRRPDDTSHPQSGDRTQGISSMVRDHNAVVDGPQTPKYTQPALEIWNKLRFWFNDDAGLSVPSVSIPFGQRFVTIDMATQDQLLHEHPGLYVCQTVDTGTAATETATTGASAGSFQYVAADDDTTAPVSGLNLGNSRFKTYRPWTGTNGIESVSLQGNPELYVNNIFVNPEIHDIFIKRIGFSLIRVWREHTSRSNQSDDEKLLSQLKWPVEYMFVGLQPTWNISDSNPQQATQWSMMSKPYTYNIAHMDHSEVNLAADNTTDATGATPAYGQTTHRYRGEAMHPMQYERATDTATQFSLSAHGVNITDGFPSGFHSSYTPFHFGGQNVNTPDDSGAMMFNFALYPGSYNPSSHINVSRAREFYLKWQGNYSSGSGNDSNLYVCARVINFLLVTDGSAVLRFAT